jgi:hypothetical protein
MFVATTLPPNDGRCYVQVSPDLGAQWDTFTLDPDLVSGVKAARGAITDLPVFDMASTEATIERPPPPGLSRRDLLDAHTMAQVAATAFLSAHAKKG